jgi:predicted transcriptional regulator YdeE
MINNKELKKLVEESIEEYLKKLERKKNDEIVQQYITNNQINHKFRFIENIEVKQFIEVNKDYEICNLCESRYAYRVNITKGVFPTDFLPLIEENPIINEFFNTHTLVIKKELKNDK